MEAEERIPVASTEIRTVSSSSLPGEDADSNPLTSIYKALSQYPFDTDAEFQAGLSSILGHPDTPTTETEKESKADLVLQAQCFYYMRKFNVTTIDPTAYKAWTQTTTSQTRPSQNNTHHSATQAARGSEPSDPPSIPSSSSEPPPYPTSFAAIVELITNNKPIPGIEDVPDTVLELGSSKQDKATRRKKPWEKDSADIVATTTPSTLDKDGKDMQREWGVAEAGDTQSVDTENVRGTGVGVMHILSPDAVPDGGLIAKE